MAQDRHIIVHTDHNGPILNFRLDVEGYQHGDTKTVISDLVELINAFNDKNKRIEIRSTQFIQAPANVDLGKLLGYPMQFNGVLKPMMVPNERVLSKEELIREQKSIIDSALEKIAEYKTMA